MNKLNWNTQIDDTLPNNLKRSKSVHGGANADEAPTEVPASSIPHPQQQQQQQQQQDEVVDGEVVAALLSRLGVHDPDYLTLEPNPVPSKCITDWKKCEIENSQGYKKTICVPDDVKDDNGKILYRGVKNEE